MSHVLITGGSGELGGALLPLLTDAGHTVRIMSRSPRRAGYDSTIEWAQASLESGDGLAQAVADVDVVVHAASDPKNSHKVDVEGTARLLRHAEAARVNHILYISIAGIERIPFAYYNAKLEAEHLIERSAIPYTILRATQFHSLMPKLFLLPATKLPLIGFVPKQFKLQLIDTGEVAVRMAELVEAGPSGRVEDIGGPEVLTLGHIAKTYLKATGKRRLLLNLPIPGKMGAALRKGYGAQASRYGKITWAQWLEREYSAAQAQPVDAKRQTARG